jgi:hypothetical protein
MADLRRKREKNESKEDDELAPERSSEGDGNR